MSMFHRTLATLSCNIPEFQYFFKEILNLNFEPYYCFTCHSFSGCSLGKTENLMWQENSNKSLFIHILTTLYMPKCFKAFCSLSYSFLYSLQSLYFHNPQLVLIVYSYLCIMSLRKITARVQR